MPTDGPDDLVAIHSIKLIPKSANFRQAAGRESIGKRDEFRNVIYAHSPSSIDLSGADTQKRSRCISGSVLRRKIGPVTFRVLVDNSDREVFTKKLADPEVWEDADIDLSAYGGRTVKLVFRTEAARPETGGLVGQPAAYYQGAQRSAQRSYLYHRYLACRPCQPVRLCARHHALSENFGSIRNCL